MISVHTASRSPSRSTSPRGGKKGYPPIGRWKTEMNLPFPSFHRISRRPCPFDNIPRLNRLPPSPSRSPATSALGNRRPWTAARGGWTLAASSFRRTRGGPRPRPPLRPCRLCPGRRAPFRRPKSRRCDRAGSKEPSPRLKRKETRFSPLPIPLHVQHDHVRAEISVQVGRRLTFWGPGPGGECPCQDELSGTGVLQERDIARIPVGGDEVELAVPVEVDGGDVDDVGAIDPKLAHLRLARRTGVPPSTTAEVRAASRSLS